MNNTLKAIQVLVTAIDSGSYTRAGEILGYTQSNLTQMMKAACLHRKHTEHWESVSAQ